MHYRWTWTLTTTLWLLVTLGCAERRDTVELNAHPAEWNQVGNSDFHGGVVAKNGPETCRSCHAQDLSGAARATSCFACHDGPGGHPVGWVNRTEPFHGLPVERFGPSGCRVCHGESYRGGWSGVSCFTCHAGGPSGHPDGWMDSRSASFHGRRVTLEGSFDCRRCHGGNLEGGTSGVACSDCHR